MEKVFCFYYVHYNTSSHVSKGTLVLNDYHITGVPEGSSPSEVRMRRLLLWRTAKPNPILAMNLQAYTCMRTVSPRMYLGTVTEFPWLRSDHYLDMLNALCTSILCLLQTQLQFKSHVTVNTALCLSVSRTCTSSVRRLVFLGLAEQMPSIY